MSDTGALYITTGTFDDDDDPAVLINVGMLNAKMHQVSVEDRSGLTIVTGTLALAGVPHGQAVAQVITDESGDPVVFDLAAPPNVVLVSGKFESFTLTPTSVGGNYFAVATGVE
jgi:hypothetical protein